MHIETGVVDGAKMILSHGTAAAAAGLAGHMAWAAVKRDGGADGLLLRAVICTALVFCFFEVLPRYPVGVSEVHFILGATLFLVFGAGAAAIGLAAGLLIQGVFFAPADLPQYFINVTTLLIPLWAVSLLAQRIVPAGTAYVDLRYRDVLALSAVYQGGVIGWVMFWAFYGQGFGAENVNNVLTFAGAYLLVIVVEPVIDLAVLAAAKAGAGRAPGKLVTARLTAA